MKRFVIFLFTVFISALVFSQSPALDLTYGTNGYTTGISNGSFTNHAEISPDDSVIIVGEANANTEFFAEKFLPNGQRDTSFGNNGFILHESLLNSKEEPSGIFIQPDGKILVAGKADVNPSLFGTYDNVFVARMMPDGSLDMSFGTSGYVKVDLGTNDDEAWGISMDPTGAIYVLGSLQTMNGEESRLIKFTDAGILDTTFGTNGILDIYFQSDTQITDIKIKNSNEIYLFGVVENVNQLNDAVVLKMDQNGVLDLNYGTAGIVTFSDGFNASGVANSFFLPNGELVVAHAVFSSATGRQVRISRLLSSGMLDASFNSTGQLYLDPSLNSYSTFFPYDLKLLHDGNYLVVNDLIRNNNYDLYFFKITPSGSLDTSFNSSGEYWLNRTTHQDYHRDVLIESDGEVIVSGMSTDFTTRFNTLTKFNGVSTLSIYSTDPSIVKVFPNPASDVLSIYNDVDIKKVVIHDINGQYLFSSSGIDQVDISMLSSGIYLLHVIDLNDQTHVVRFIKD